MSTQGRLDIMNSVISDMENSEAKRLVEVSIANDDNISDVLISLRSAVVISSLAADDTISNTKEKDIAIEALSNESKLDKSFKEDLSTAIMYIDKNYKIRR